MKLTQFQLKELSKYWLDLSKITLASLVVKFFEPTVLTATIISLITIVAGLTFAALFVMVSLRLSKGVKR